MRVVHAVEVEDFDFCYGLYADEVKVASFAGGRAGYREWAMRTADRAHAQPPDQPPPQRILSRRIRRSEVRKVECSVVECFATER